MAYTIPSLTWFQKRTSTLFVKRENGKLIVTQVYVDDIIFGSTKDELGHEFSKLIQAEFEMSMIVELNYSLDCRFVSKSQVYSYLNLNMPKIL